MSPGIQQVNNHVEHGTLILGIHALVDFVHTAERHKAEILEGHYVEHCLEIKKIKINIIKKSKLKKLN